ncbi:unnamed protein product [Ceutorhynchus assimilis]|uniref:Pectinesterase n=1 Tax=Ceutorhynchus assimilis TaxID=467358 RepID=A0A9N9QB25_9CUCU|nr:unnamed protein product [Ceutorhynchus assimilis]
MSVYKSSEIVTVLKSEKKMLHQIVLALLVAMAFADHQIWPGTSTRPILSDAEASKYTKQAYLQGWTPGTISTSRADYTVGSGGFSTIQAAVNAAINAGGTTRKYIKILPGTYNQAVLIPKTSVPITIYGTKGNPDDVQIVLSQGANLSGSEYAQQVNPNGAVYKDGDPAWSMYSSCAKKTKIGTSCSSIFWAKNDDFEIAYVTIENPSLDGQAVAARADGDKQNWNNINFYGFQDVLFASGKRIYFNKPIIVGDVDFIFGSASAVFEGAQIFARGDRPRDSAIIFAPNTESSQKYGFLVLNSKIMADINIKANMSCSLARAWDASSSKEPNGQVVIRETDIVDVVNLIAPYDTATSGRKYAGNSATNRNLDDSRFNRFWEYKNVGAGA